MATEEPPGYVEAVRNFPASIIGQLFLAACKEAFPRWPGLHLAVRAGNREKVERLLRSEPGEAAQNLLHLWREAYPNRYDFIPEPQKHPERKQPSVSVVVSPLPTSPEPQLA
ncbi:MAG TPA: hypothetical protein VD907_01445 [Verrucomicrobiae bacterium]|nr:hypothetical protein [Verrucomicrobiae bacterium]